jgi:hypothetical protein
MFGCTRSIADFAIGVVLVNKILHNRPALKDTLRTIENGGDTSVGINFEKPSIQNSYQYVGRYCREAIRTLPSGD